MNLHILTLSYNGLDKLISLHNSLVPALKNINYQWHIKSNGCTDQTTATSSKWDNTTVYAYPNNNQNYSEGMNFLFDQIKAKDDDYVLFLNNDVIFNDTTSIHKMIDIMEKDPGVSVVGARLLFPDGTIQHQGVVFNAFNKFPIHFRSKQIADENSKINRIFQSVTGAVCLTKYSVFRKNLYNPLFRWSFDDIDWCLRAGRFGKIIYCGATQITHQESATLRKNPINKLFMNHNLDMFMKLWQHSYIVDEELYKDQNYNIYKAPK